MDDEQFKAVTELLREIADNTKPPGKLRRTLEITGLVVAITSGLELIQKLIQFLWG